ncbi:MAG: PAS domain S-box protein [Magnetospirillum sp.]|nr:PAS domain S-box protein [Magnetospirillum sp.]
MPAPLDPSPHPLDTQPRVIGRGRLLVALVIPVMALTAFGGYVVWEKLDGYRHNAVLLATAEMAQSAHALARELQEERDLSALFIGAGRNHWAQPLDRQRTDTDTEAAGFRRLVDRPQMRMLLGRGRPIPGVGDIDALRAEVDGDARIETVLRGYGRMISSVLATPLHLTAEDPATLITAYTDLGNIKDRIGRERSLGLALLLQSGQSRDLAPLLAETHAAIVAFIESFHSHASPEQEETYTRIVSDAAVARVQSLYAKAAAGQLRDADARAWEEAHATLNDQLAQAEDVLAHQMDGYLGAKLNSAKYMFYLLAIVVLALVAFAIETLRRSERRVVLAEDASRKLFRAVQQSPVAVTITDTAGFIDYVNPAFCQASGYTFGEMLGRNPRVLKSGLTPPVVYADMWRTIVSGQEWRGEICNRRKDGSLFWVSATMSAVRGANGDIVNYIAFEEDITEVKQLRQALEREHDNIRRILETMRDGIALVDSEQDFIYVNPALTNDFGPLRGRNCSEYFGSGAESSCPFRSDGAPPADIEHREWRSPAGKVYEVASAPVHSPDGSLSVLRIFHDITVRKHAEEAMNAAREAAELANRAKTEFLAAMSHELRTPLNAIIGFSEIMAEQLLGPIGQQQYADYCADINHSGRHLLNVIEDILDVARLEVGKVDLYEEEADLGVILKSSAALVTERAAENGVALAIETPGDLLLLRVDVGRLKQVLFNVLGNAIKFTPAGGSVLVSARLAETGGLDIVVADTGIGIAEDDLAKVMAPFGQADSGMARRYEGAGLGLSLARQLMRLHGGELNLDSALGQGTTVTLRFPGERVRVTRDSSAD